MALQPKHVGLQGTMIMCLRLDALKWLKRVWRPQGGIVQRGHCKIELPVMLTDSVPASGWR